MKEASVRREETIVSDEETSEVSQPGEGPLDCPAPLVRLQPRLVLRRRLRPVLSVRRDELDASIFQSLSKGIAVIGPVGDAEGQRSIGFLLPNGFSEFKRSVLHSVFQHSRSFQRRFRQLHFRGRGRRKENSQRNTLAIDQYHPLGSLSSLRFTDGRSPFFAGAKLPSRKVSSHTSNPSTSNKVRNARQTHRRRPFSSHS